MRQVVPYKLWLGHVGEASDFRLVFDAGIEAIVDLAVEASPSPGPRELIVCRFPLVDGPGNEPKLLRLAIETLANLVESHVPVLVTCGAGMSRSPAIAAAALSMVYQSPPDECLKTIAEHHPADVAPGLWKDVKAVLEADRV